MSDAAPQGVRELVDTAINGARVQQGVAYEELMRLTVVPVPWVYAVWDELLAALTHTDNHTRTIAAQLLCNLAKSDTKKRLKADLDRIFDVTHDEKFVTARHTIQSLWKIGVPDKAMRKHLLDRIETRFNVAAGEKNGTLVRYDRLVGLKKLADETGDGAIETLARVLIARETDPKYAKKYRTVWKG